MYHNSIDICVYGSYVLQINCEKAEEGLKTISSSECILNALAIDNPIEYACLYLDGNMQTWIDALENINT